MSEPVKHGGIVMPDADSVFSTIIKPAKDLLTQDMVYLLPDTIGKLASLQDVTALKDDMVGGVLSAGDSSKLGGQPASYYAKNDLSNVDPVNIPSEVINTLKGDKGATIHIGTAGTPSSSVGVSGDVYIITETGVLYQKNASNVWHNMGSIKGPQGVQGLKGIDGTILSVSTSVPGTAQGKTDDIHINMATGDVSVKQAGGSWSVAGSIKGPKGDKGDKGLKGDPGVPNPNAVNSVEWDGARKYVSSAAPSGGSDGDIWYQY